MIVIDSIVIIFCHFADQYVYDANGNTTAEYDWLGNRTTFRYDMLDRLIEIIDATGTRIETLIYTDNHLQAASIDALGNRTRQMSSE